MASPRWRKLRGDLRAAWGRVLVMQLAIAASVAAVGTVLATRAVLGREIRASYAATEPADATLELAGDVDDAVLAAVRARPEVAAADRRQMVRARVRTGADAAWQPLVLFAADFGALQLNTFAPEAGAWPPPRGAILLERTAVAVIGGGTELTVQTPAGAPTQVAVAGTVHDAGQAPSWQEHRGCAYTTRETLAALGEPPVLHDLLIRFRSAGSLAEVEDQARRLAGWLRDSGHAVHEIRAPKLRQHPHQALMDAVQTVLLVFTLILLVLSSIVVATILATILARQTRDIGVMKALGATTGQLAALYGAFVVGLGAIAAAAAMPLAAMLGHGMTRGIAGMMNITLADPAIPAWVYVAIALLAIGVPLALAAVPILRATRLSVRRALADHGARDFARPGLARLPIAIRNGLRRPSRLALTMAMLVVGGAFVIAAANLDRSLMSVSGKVAAARHYDIEVRLETPVALERVAGLAHLAGVRTFEAWSATDAALGDIVHTYPDGGHGSFTLTALPPGGTALVDFPVRAGRWLVPGDTDAIVLGNAGGRIGDRIVVTVDGRPTSWTVVGIVEEVAGGSGFVTAAGLARATGGTGVSLLRVATGADRAGVIAALEAVLARDGIAVRYAMPLGHLRSIIDDHIVLVVRAVILMAIVLALVGMLGLGSAIAIGVAERTREIGILKAIGASDGRLARIVLGEALFVGTASAVLAVVLGLPLTLLLGARLGATGLLAQPPFAVAPLALVGWPLATIAGSLLASLLPARRAARLRVATALGEV